MLMLATFSYFMHLYLHHNNMQFVVTNLLLSVPCRCHEEAKSSVVRSMKKLTTIACLSYIKRSNANGIWSKCYLK